MRVVIVIKIDFRYIGTREHCNAARKFPTAQMGELANSLLLCLDVRTIQTSK